MRAMGTSDGRDDDATTNIKSSRNRTTKREPATVRREADTICDHPPRGAALTLLSAPEVGPRLSLLPEEDSLFRYAYKGVVGVGGMGQVLLCRDGRMGRDVAYKRLSLEGRDASAEIRNRFEREARVQAQLEHPGVVPVYDISVDHEGEPYFTMKRVQGVSLREVVESLRAQDPKAIAYFTRHKLLSNFCSVCLTVDYAHSRGVIHRDLKPENVMLGEYGEVSVLDWGLAKVAGEQEPEPTSLAHVVGGAKRSSVDLPAGSVSPTVHGTVMGTPGYMPPEQAAGELDLVGPRMDVYALGAILFELLTLEQLNDNDDDDGARKYDPLSSTGIASERAPDRNVPPELDQVCLRATQLDPVERHASARELHDEVDRFLQGDLDLERRGQLADDHAEEAKLAMQAARDGQVDERSARAEAARSLRSALALVPTHQEALAAMIQLLVELPEELPAEAHEEIEKTAEQHRLNQGRAVGFAQLSILALVPFGL